MDSDLPHDILHRQPCLKYHFVKVSSIITSNNLHTKTSAFQVNHLSLGKNMGEKPFGDVIDELSCPDVMT